MALARTARPWQATLGARLLLTVWPRPRRLGTRLPVLPLFVAACGCGEAPRAAPEDEALSTELAPSHAAEHYVDQALRYFDALDQTSPPDSLPSYGERVIRWEWPPWLLLFYGISSLIQRWE